jgi:hypothetical protein
MDGIYNLIRSTISADKRRFNDGVYDLDLCYVTERVLGMSMMMLLDRRTGALHRCRSSGQVAESERQIVLHTRHCTQPLCMALKRVTGMSFPADGVESTYRNHIEEVAAMLQQYHPDHFRIFNLTERDYDTYKLNHRACVNTSPSHPSCSNSDHNDNRFINRWKHHHITAARWSMQDGGITTHRHWRC